MNEKTIEEVDKRVSMNLTELLTDRVVHVIVLNAETVPHIIAVVFKDNTALLIKCHGGFEIELRDHVPENARH